MTSKKFALLFPGQGSQSVGMGSELANHFPTAKLIFEKANQILGFDLTDLMWHGPDSTLNDTINTQPALLVHSIAAYSVLKETMPDIRPAFVAGHSMGELSALVAAEALSFEKTLVLTRTRGELMKLAGERSPGGMAAILGLAVADLENICAQASTPQDIVQVANDNCPGQVVISGSSTALEKAMELAKAAGARRIRPLAVSIAAHSPLMAHAQNDFIKAVENAQLNDPLVPVLGNVSAQPLTTGQKLSEDLQAQLTSRVRWTESIQEMTRQGVTTFIELGSGSVLTGLNKRIDDSVTGIAIGNPADYEKLSLDP